MSLFVCYLSLLNIDPASAVQQGYCLLLQLSTSTLKHLRRKWPVNLASLDSNSGKIVVGVSQVLLMVMVKHDNEPHMRDSRDLRSLLEETRQRAT